ncbi:MAG: NAD(+)/NADH kinase [Anaerolineales bacterium]
MKRPERIAVAAHPQMTSAAHLADEVLDFLADFDLEVVKGTLYEDALRAHVTSGEVDLLIALGGDGTMLRAGHLCAPENVPILGINLGGLGFLIEIQHSEWKPSLERVLEGDFWLEKRMMLRAEHCRENELLGTWHVLNECVIGRAEIVRPVHLTAEIDGQTLTTYVADGLIVSTATGSTAYALAAGGPILPPELRNILLVPVAPHLSVDRAIVLHEGSEVHITVRTEHQASLSVDGQDPIAMLDRDTVRACASEHHVEFVRLQDPDYFYRNLTSRMNENPSVGASQ